MTDFDDDSPFWDPPEWGKIPGPARRAHGERTRTHHVVVRRSPLPPLDRIWDADAWAGGVPDSEEPPDVDAWLEPVETAPRRVRFRGRAGVDPRLLRLGALVTAVVLMVPIALALRDRGGSGLRTTGDTERTTAAPDLLAGRGAAHHRRVRESRPKKRPATTAVAAVDPEPTAPADEVVEVAVAHNEPACAGKYTVVAGDYWVRFAESSGTDLDAWLNANGATAETPLYAGDVLCIPQGAAAPEPPPTTTEAPETTAAPTTTDTPAATAAPTKVPTTEAPETTATPTTATPTTATPTTAAPPPVAAPPETTSPPDPVDPGSVEAIIRAVWPDELEDRALVIAQRESGLQPDAFNGWCCYGLFQIYFDANRSFLASLGVTSAQQLLDARTNATVAFAMYQRSGWAPWATTDPG
jgi:hypothetical protein